MKKLLIALLLCFTLSTVAPVAQAAKPVGVTGTLTIEASSVYAWGGHIDMTMDVQGKLTHGSAVYTTLAVKQDDQIVYAWSEFAPYFSFPLQDQQGDGLNVDPTQPGVAEAWLIYRQPNGKGYTYTKLDVVTFTVAPTE